MRNFNDLVQITARLTNDDGCPWDKAQTHQSIRVNMIEEAYEAVDAIDKADKNAMIEELGDVLLQAVFHADIARRNGDFTIDDIIEGVCEKLVSRHTHIFGNENAANADDALKNWEAQKIKEKKQSSLAQQLNSLPKALPSLLYAQKIIKKTGFNGEKQRLKALIDNLNIENAGEMLFLAASVCLKEGLNPEVELNTYNKTIVAHNA